MIEVRNLNKKLVGKLNNERTVYISECKGYITTITVNPDKTLNISQSRVAKKTA